MARNTTLQDAVLETIARWVTLRRIRAYAALMLVLALGGGVAQIALGEGLVDRNGNAIGGDFIAFYTGARLYAEGSAAELYDLQTQHAFQRSLTAPGELRGVDAFISPPHALALYAPFGLVSYPVGLALWWVAGLAALVGSAWLLRAEFASLRRHSTVALAAASFGFFPTVAWLLFGQATPFVLFLYAASFVALRRERDFSAGLLLGALAFKPQLALGLAVALVLNRRWRAVAGGAIATGASLALGLALSPEATLDYWSGAGGLFGLLRSDAYPGWGIHSAFGFSLLLLDGISPRAADLLTLGLTALLLVALAIGWRGVEWRPGSRAWDLAMAGTFALGLLLSPHLFLYDLMLLLLPFAIAYEHYPYASDARVLDAGSLLAWSAAVWLASFLAKPLCLAALRVSEWGGLPAVAVQLSTVAIGGWAICALRSARTPRLAEVGR